MEVVLIAVLITLCWAVWRQSTALDRPRRAYDARHILGSLPENFGNRRRRGIRRKHRAPAISARANLVATQNREDEFDDDWFPPFNNWIQSGRLTYIDPINPTDIAPSRLLSTLYFDDTDEPIELHRHDRDDFQVHYDYYDEP
jgi:hypothetical protein